MPGYAFLSDTRLKTGHLPASLKALSRAGVPYSDTQIKDAATDAARQADAEQYFEGELQESYGENVQVRDFDGQPDKLTEMDALVAYLQVLGTLADLDSLNLEEINR